VADRRLQHPGPAGACRLPQTMGHRMHVRRRQDPRPQHRGHPARMSAQARPAHGTRRARHRLGRARSRRPARIGLPRAQGARPPRPVLVPHRLRPDTKPARLNPGAAIEPWRRLRKPSS
jgi:hypothetical protein